MKSYKLILVLIIPGFLFAQSSLDILRQKIESSKGKEKIKSYLDLSFKLRKDSYDEARNLAGKALDLAESSHDKFYIARSLETLGRIHFSNNNYIRSIDFARLAIKNSNEIKYDSLTAEIYKRLAAYFKKIDKTDSAIKYYELSQNLFLMEGLNSRAGQSLNSLAILYKKRGDLTTSFKLSNEALEYFQKANDKMAIAKQYNNLALIYYNWGAFDKALEYFFQSIQIKNTFRDSISLAKSYHNIGLVYSKMQNNELALKYLFKSLDLKKELNNNSIALTYTLIGSVYLEMNDLKNALHYYNISINIREKIDDKGNLAFTNMEIGDLYQKQKKYKLAQNFYNKSLSLFGIVKDSTGITRTNYRIAKSLRLTKKYSEAIKFLSIAEKYAKKTNLKLILSSIYLEFSKTYERSGNYSKALAYNKKHSKLKADLLSDRRIKRVQEIAAIYKIGEKEEQILALRNEAIIDSLDLESQKNYNLLLISILIASLSSILILYYLYRNSKKSKSLISEQNRELDKLNDELVSINKTKDHFLSIISHDLKNPIGNILNYVNLLKSDFNQISNSEKYQIIREIKNSSERTHNLLNNLLQWALSQEGRLNLNMERNEISQLISYNLDVLEGLIRDKNIEINNKITQKQFANFDLNSINTVVRNLLTNAIKFTHQNGLVIIDKEIIDDEIIISISDNGIGLSSEDLSSLFNDNAGNNSIGNSSEKGTGLGLILCQEFIEKNSGRIWATSKLNHGSIFYFSLKLGDNEILEKDLSIIDSGS